MDTKKYLQQWAEKYKNDLLNDIMPFWMEHGLDRKHGGVYTCVNRDGSLIDTTKSVWFQGRFAFICAFAYNNVERKQEWLDACKSTLDFIENHCFDTDGHMFFSVTEDGTPLRVMCSAIRSPSSPCRNTRSPRATRPMPRRPSSSSRTRSGSSPRPDSLSLSMSRPSTSRATASA